MDSCLRLRNYVVFVLGEVRAIGNSDSSGLISAEWFNRIGVLLQLLQVLSVDCSDLWSWRFMPLC